MPRMHAAAATATAEVIDRFREALAARDIVLPERIIADGSIHRCDVAGKNGKGDAAYLLHLDGIPAGGLENWRDGKGWESWRLDIGRALTPAELAALRDKVKTARSQRTEEAVRRHTAAREVAARIWHAARPVGDEHPYLARKGVVAHGLRVFKGALVIPICDAAGKLHSLQFIGASGTKRFLKGRRIAGLYFLIGVAGKVVCIAEGYATGASIHAATGYAVAVAFNAGNLGPVARAIRKNQPEAQLIVCADGLAFPGVGHREQIKGYGTDELMVAAHVGQALGRERKSGKGRAGHECHRCLHEGLGLPYGLTQNARQGLVGIRLRVQRLGQRFGLRPFATARLGDAARIENAICWSFGGSDRSAHGLEAPDPVQIIEVRGAGRTIRTKRRDGDEGIDPTRSLPGAGETWIAR